MTASIKFSSKLEKKTLDELRSYAEESKKNISVVLNEAVTEYLEKVRLRPAFLQASSKVIEKHRELLKRLAQ